MGSTGVLEHTIDVDSHEMAPAHVLGEVFGEAMFRVGELTSGMERGGRHPNSLYAPGLRDDAAIDYESVWNVRGAAAPSAFDFTRRLEVMDLMGIDRQLVFPSFVIVAVQLMLEESFILRGIGQDSMSKQELDALSRRGIDEYNDWAVRTTAIEPNRLRPVAYLAPADSPEALIEQAQDLVARGIAAVHISCGTPPGGRSPADNALDPLWALLAENNVACTTHVGGDGDFKRSDQWVKAPAFKLGWVESHELGLEPYSFATLHLTVSNFLVCMTLGGVFERHPKLRFGVIECGAHWFGPLAESLDMWEREMYHTRLEPFISMPPSEYLKRNVRVNPFNTVEPVEDFLRRYPDLQDCYCYSTDYPHTEGGTDMARKFYERIAPLGSDIVEKFFVTNGMLLLPDR